MTIFWQRVSKCLSHVSRVTECRVLAAQHCSTPGPGLSQHVAGGVTDSAPHEDDEDLAAEAAGGRREGQLRHATGLAGAGTGLRAGGSVVKTKQKYILFT